MKSLPTILLASLILAAVAHAQEQEAGMMERSLNKARTGAASPMQNKEFSGAGAFTAKEFAATNYAGIKDANTKKFTTKSFFGIKNPWFGNEVYDAPTANLTHKTDRFAEDSFSVDDFATADYAAADEGSALIKKPTPRAETPREFAVFDPFERRSETTAELQGFTDTFQRDLSIDEVRALLNKGQD